MFSLVFRLFSFSLTFFLSEGGFLCLCSFRFQGGFCFYACLFQAILCHALAPRVLRLVLSAVGSSKKFGLSYERGTDVERCFVLCWLNNSQKRICIGQESLNQRMPRSELIPLAHFVYSLPNARLPLCVCGASPSLVRVIEDNRNDGRRFVMHMQFTEDIFLQCVRQAHQDVFGMVEVTSLVDYVIIRLQSAIY